MRRRHNRYYDNFLAASYNDSYDRGILSMNIWLTVIGGFGYHGDQVKSQKRKVSISRSKVKRRKQVQTRLRGCIAGVSRSSAGEICKTITVHWGAPTVTYTV